MSSYMKTFYVKFITIVFYICVIYIFIITLAERICQIISKALSLYLGTVPGGKLYLRQK